jgi:hypothetical protein
MREKEMKWSVTKEENNLNIPRIGKGTCPVQLTLEQ